MANVMVLLKATALTYVPHGAARSPSLKSYAIDKGERYGGALLFGFLKGYYREKAMIKGIPVDALAGGALLIGGAVLAMVSKGRSGLLPHMNALGDAGVSSWLNSIGAAWGAKKSGRQVYVLNKGATAPAALPAGMTAVGEIPQAAMGSVLSPADIANYTESR